MIIKVDIDGVLRNMNDMLVHLYNQRFKTNLTVEELTDYDVSKSFPLFEMWTHTTAVEYFFNEHKEEVFFEANPYSGVKEAMQKLMDNGHKVVIVTWQFTTMNKKLTLDWLDENKIPYDDICFTRDKWMIQGDIIIDDNPELILNEKETAYKYLVDQPYNQECNFEGSRVKSLSEAVDLVCR